MTMLIVYDIANNKQRRLVSDILEGYGTRVNKSVFECHLKNEKQKRHLLTELKKSFNPKLDSIRIYSICQKCVVNSFEIGMHPDPFEYECVYFV